MCQALIEVSREKSDERRVDPPVGVDARHRLEQITVPCQRRLRNRWPLAGPFDRMKASGPQVVHRLPFFPHVLVEVAETR